MKSLAIFLVCAVLATIVISTCLRIEVLNEQCGGILPREIRTDGGNPKWRVAAQRTARAMAERHVLMERIDRGEGEWTDYLDDEGMVLPTIAFSEPEQRYISDRMTQARLNGDLRSLVGGMGLLQYVLSPLLLLLSVGLVAKSDRFTFRLAGALFAVIACITILVMLDRAYFTSLGW